MGINQGLFRKFIRMIFIPDLDWLENTAVSRHYPRGTLGSDARQSFISPPDEMLKRLMDIILSLLLGILCLPVLLLTALLIKIDSPGPVLYKQVRVGKDGHRIGVWKFRSMHVNADNMLIEYLAENPDAQTEWGETQKLREDPRITRVGKWARQFSIDELPQLYNILMGDMSMVGPRPILFEQKNLYGEGIHVYTSVKPGLTGYWQVSGRNRTTFGQRVIFDLYYIENWSFSMDIYILLRTVWVVLSRDGAY